MMKERRLKEKNKEARRQSTNLGEKSKKKRLFYVKVKTHRKDINRMSPLFNN